MPDDKVPRSWNRRNEEAALQGQLVELWRANDAEILKLKAENQRLKELVAELEAKQYVSETPKEQGEHEHCGKLLGGSRKPHG